MALSLTGCLARWYSSTGAIHGNGRAGFQRQNRRESQWQGIGALIVGLSSGEREAPNDAAHEAGAGSAGDGSAQRAGGWPDGPSGGHGVRGGPDGQPDIGGKPGSGNGEVFAQLLCSSVNPKLVLFSIDRNLFDNPREVIIRGVKSTLPNAHIMCTQLSKKCAAQLPEA